MVFEIQQDFPSFVHVHYDVTDNHQRDILRMKLYELGMRMDTESVYVGLFTNRLIEEVQRIEKTTKGAVIKVLTPTYPQFQILIQRKAYEDSFAQDFDELEEKLPWLEEIITFDGELPKDKKEVDKLLERGVITTDRDTGIPQLLTAQQVMSRFRHVQHIHGTLGISLEKRKKRDGQDAFTKAFERLGRQLRSAGDTLEKMEKTIKRKLEQEKARSTKSGSVKK